MIKCAVCKNSTTLTEREAIGLGWWTISKDAWDNGPTLHNAQWDVLWRCNRHVDTDLKPIRDGAYYSEETRLWHVSDEVLEAARWAPGRLPSWAKPYAGGSDVHIVAGGNPDIADDSQNDPIVRRRDS